MSFGSSFTLQNSCKTYTMLMSDLLILIFLWGIGTPELLILFAIILLVFGGRKLPGLARSIGSGINEFKRGLSGEKSEEDKPEEAYLAEENETESKPKKKSARSKKPQ